MKPSGILPVRLNYIFCKFKLYKSVFTLYKEQNEVKYLEVYINMFLRSGMKKSSKNKSFKVSFCEY